MLGGGPAYLILDGRLYLGLNGSYLEGNTDEFMIGYGGPSAGWLLFPGSRFSLWLGATAALGGVREPAAGGSGVFVLEPEAIAQLAIGPYSRLGLGASYRLALPFEELAGYGARELSGPSLVVRLAYGVFGQADREAGGAPGAGPRGCADPAPGRASARPAGRPGRQLVAEVQPGARPAHALRRRLHPPDPEATLGAGGHGLPHPRRDENRRR